MECLEKCVKGEIEELSKKCIDIGIDPVHVLSNALRVKNRLEGLIQEALEEEKPPGHSIRKELD